MLKIPNRTPEQIRKLHEAIRAIRERQAREDKPKRYVPKTGPHDEVYHEGLRWLNSL